MRTADHPARHPPGYKPPDPKDDLSIVPVQQTIHQTGNESEPIEAVAATSPGNEPSDETGTVLKSLPAAGNVEDTSAPQDEWVPIDDTTPRDGRDVRLRYTIVDAEGRLAHWHQGRRFTGRRWVPGGRWAPSDGMMPLPGMDPIEWLRPVEFTEVEAEDAAEPAAA